MNRPFRSTVVVLATAALACRQPDRAPVVETVRLPPLAPISAPATVADSTILGPPPPRWPVDAQGYQLANIDSLKLVVSKCGESGVIAADSVGSLRLGLTYEEVIGRCPGALAVWDLGETGIPSPVLVVQVGTSRYILSVDDTLATSKVTTISTSDSTAKTASGAGPGMLFSELRKIHGIPTLDAAGCVLVASFRGVSGLSFRLDTGRFIKCSEIPIVARDNSVERLPPTASIRTVVISRPGASSP